MSRRIKLLLPIALLATVALASCSSDTGSLETVSPEAAAEAIAENPSAIVLDIRTPQEYSEGIIEGAMNIDFYESDFAARLDQLDKSAEYVVYCRTGNRSGQAMNTFRDLGFTNITEVDGGIVNWYGAGLPVVLP